MINFRTNNRFQDLSFQRLYAFMWILLGHVALGYLIFTLQWKMLLVALAVHYVIMNLGISMTYHRAISHNAITLPRWLEFIGMFIAGLAMQGSAISWAAVHRQHHKYQGTDKDPHSPKVMGAWYVQIFVYTFSKVDPRSVVPLMKGRYAIWHRYYYWIYLPIIIGSLFVLPFNWALALFWAPIAITYHFEGFVNTWLHDWNRDVPVNRPMVTFFSGSEAWHENHHAYPGRVKFHDKDWLGIVLEKYFGRKTNAS